MNEVETKVLIIETLDHFRTTKVNTSKCTLRYIGEYAGEDDNYITLRYKNVYFGDEGTEKLIKIVKNAIINRREFVEVK